MKQIAGNYRKPERNLAPKPRKLTKQELQATKREVELWDAECRVHGRGNLLCGACLPWNRAGSAFQCFVLNIAGYGWISCVPTDGTGIIYLGYSWVRCVEIEPVWPCTCFSMVEPCIFLQLFCKGFGPLCPLPFIEGKFLLNYDCGGKCVSTFSVL